jgi:hypothetical protein
MSGCISVHPLAGSNLVRSVQLSDRTEPRPVYLVHNLKDYTLEIDILHDGVYDMYKVSYVQFNPNCNPYVGFRQEALPAYYYYCLSPP